MKIKRRIEKLLLYYLCKNQKKLTVGEANIVVRRCRDFAVADSACSIFLETENEKPL